MKMFFCVITGVSLHAINKYNATSTSEERRKEQERGRGRGYRLEL